MDEEEDIENMKTMYQMRLIYRNKTLNSQFDEVEVPVKTKFKPR